MEATRHEKEFEIMSRYFGKDNLLSLATADGEIPSVRCIDAFFDNGSFYAISYALSAKMRQIEQNSKVGFCSPDWLVGHGIAKNLGYIYSPENMATAEKLKVAFAAWYDNGHNDYNDKNTVILEIKVSDCKFYHEGKQVFFKFD